MKIEDIERMAESIVEQGRVECDFIEYKKSATFKDRILKTACAYANDYMRREIGLILIDIEEVDEEDGRKAIPKRPIAGIDDSLIESTENGLKSLLAEVHPKIDYKLVTCHADGRSFIVVAVEPGTAGSYETSEKAQRDRKISLKAGRYIRVGRDTRLPNKREEFELLKRFSGIRFTSELNATATLDDLSYEYMREYLIATNAKQDMRELSKLDMAKSMGLINESDYGGYRARNFAVLMFADTPQKFIPYARIEVIREADGTDKMESKAFTGPVWVQARQVIRYFEDEIMASYTIREDGRTGHRIVYNWPAAMFAELATNCVLHKEYDSDSYIGIYVYPDRMTFVNHNRPLPPVTIEDLNEKTSFDDRNYLNPELRDMFFALDLIESYGSGIRRAKRAMAENGSPALVFEPSNDDDDYTMATAFINEEFAAIRAGETSETSKTGTGTKTSIKTSTKTGTEQGVAAGARERILDLVEKNPSISITDMGKRLGLSRSGVRYHIDALQQDGILKHVGPTRGGVWKVSK
ncbi:ATP-binding protein [Curtanaerobium respiraculi]|uniref:ATP-binding protein n=1 Tax=Curtanaerobium respiraculi TaxID=2949669 RepID=UPI0024B32F87|nr:winged helix-turn-helix transcriptional regulator [Curtanaerobium respiraculi]